MDRSPAVRSHEQQVPEMLAVTEATIETVSQSAVDVFLEMRNPEISNRDSRRLYEMFVDVLGYDRRSDVPKHIEDKADDLADRVAYDVYGAAAIRKAVSAIHDRSGSKKPEIDNELAHMSERQRRLEAGFVYDDFLKSWQHNSPNTRALYRVAKMVDEVSSSSIARQHAVDAALQIDDGKIIPSSQLHTLERVSRSVDPNDPVVAHAIDRIFQKGQQYYEKNMSQQNRACEDVLTALGFELVEAPAVEEKPKTFPSHRVDTEKLKTANETPAKHLKEVDPNRPFDLATDISLPDAPTRNGKKVYVKRIVNGAILTGIVAGASSQMVEAAASPAPESPVSSTTNASSSSHDFGGGSITVLGNTSKVDESVQVQSEPVQQSDPAPAASESGTTSTPTPEQTTPTAPVAEVPVTVTDTNTTVNTNPAPEAKHEPLEAAATDVIIMNAVGADTDTGSTPIAQSDGGNTPSDTSANTQTAPADTSPQTTSDGVIIMDPVSRSGDIQPLDNTVPKQQAAAQLASFVTSNTVYTSSANGNPNVMLASTSTTQFNAPKFQAQMSTAAAMLSNQIGRSTNPDTQKQQASAALRAAVELSNDPSKLSSTDMAALTTKNTVLLDLMVKAVYSSPDILGGDIAKPFADSPDALNAIYKLLASADIESRTADSQAQMQKMLTSQLTPAKPAPAQPAAPATPPAATTTDASAAPAPNQAPVSAELPSQDVLNQQAADAMIKMGGDWTNRGIALKFLLSKGLDMKDASAIIGNLMAESGLNPHRTQDRPDSDNLPGGIRDSKGYGIAQWTSGGRQDGLVRYAQSVGKPSGDLQTQLEYLWQEATGSYGDVLAHMKAAGSPEDAAFQWMGPNVRNGIDSGGFENPSHQYDHADVRQGNARLVFDTGNARLGEVTNAAKQAQAAAQAKAAAAAQAAAQAKAAADAQAKAAAANSANSITSPAAGHFEYTLSVPQGAYGHDVYYTNQVTDFEGSDPDSDGIDGDSACRVVATFAADASFDNNASISFTQMREGLMNSGALARNNEMTSNSAYASYLESNMGLHYNVIKDDHSDSGHLDGGDLQNIRNELKAGHIVIVRSLSSVSASGSNPTSSHYAIIYAADDQGHFWVANEGHREDSPQGGKPFTDAQIAAWVNGIYSVNKI